MNSFRWFKLLLLLSFTGNVMAQNYPSGFSQVQVVKKLNKPTALAFSKDGRIFISEQGGHLKIVKNGVLLPTAFIKLPVDSLGERGLLGVALDPNFESNSYVFVYYTVPGAGVHNRVSRVVANGDIAVGNSETILLELPLLGAFNHNGGGLAFGKDEKLYIATGDNAKGVNGQNLDVLLGKLLRINTDGTVPDDNPFSAGTGARRFIWAYGFRNPFSFSVQATTGRIFVNDVGSDQFEEINDASIAGRNFGWHDVEGPGTNPLFTNPVYYYPHDEGCAVTGGTFFDPVVTNYPSQYFGKYFLMDMCGRWFRMLDLAGDPSVATQFGTTSSLNPVSLTSGLDGNLYYLGRGANALFKIVYNNPTAPFITVQPAGKSVLEGQPASFHVQAIGSLPLHYQWQKDGVDLPAATNADLILNPVSPADSGQYRVKISNIAGNILSDPIKLDVGIVYTAPVAKITSPLSASTYAAGTSIDFSGIATDVQEGSLNGTSLDWAISFYVNGTLRNSKFQNGIATGAFAITDSAEATTDVWYRFILTATDSTDLKSSDTVDIHPRKSIIGLQTSPTRLQLLLDEQPISCPAYIESVEGTLHVIGMISPQTLDESIYEFTSWAHGGTESQQIVTGADSTSYTADFSLVTGLADEAQGIFLFPNPTIERRSTLEIYSNVSQTVIIRLIDILSRNVDQFNYELNKGKNTIPLAVEKLVNGTYFVAVQLEDHEVMMRLVIGR